jgi:hypothetical protein
MAFDCRCISAPFVARRAKSFGYWPLLAPCDPSASTISVRHRICEQEHQGMGFEAQKISGPVGGQPAITAAMHLAFSIAL